jgi:hypothetical protein
VAWFGNAHQHGSRAGDDVDDSVEVFIAQCRRERENLTGGTAFDQQCPVAVVEDPRRNAR